MARKDGIVDALTGGIDGLFKKNKVMKVVGRSRLLGGGKARVRNGDDSRVLEATHVLVATGSKPATLRGIEEDGDRIGNPTAALTWPEVPGNLIVIGAGYIGLELGSVWRLLDSEVVSSRCSIGSSPAWTTRSPSSRSAPSRSRDCRSRSARSCSRPP